MCNFIVDIISLKKEMIEKGFTTNESLCEASGVDRNTLSKILNGKIRPTTVMIDRLATAMDMSSEQAGQIFFAQKLTQNVS